jgi:hypothetical protein
MRKHDVLRPLIWSNPSIEKWYRQNLYIFSGHELPRLDDLNRFEPDFVLAGSDVISRATFGWSSRALKYLPLIRRVHSLLSRLPQSSRGGHGTASGQGAGGR